MIPRTSPTRAAMSVRTLLLLALFVTILLVRLGDQPVAGAAPTLSNDDKQTILRQHNEVRARYNVPALAWDDSLAAFATEWANMLAAGGVTGHRPDNKYGENLWQGSPPDSSPVTAAVDGWAGEVQDYVVATNTCAASKDCGHFTQIVWSTTAKVGCAKASGNNWDYIVCNYDPPGNIGGVSPFAPTLGNGTAPGPGNGPPIDAPHPSTGIGSGRVVADFGFRPEKDGLPFENYSGAGYTDLTPVELRRIFGDSVCAAITNCVLTPAAQQWMTQQNTLMSGGHCFGFSVASLRLFQQGIKADPFGAPSTGGLKLDGNALLQREIAYSFVYQMFDSVRGAIIDGTPNDILDKTIEYLKKGRAADETYTIGFFMPDGKGGHAVTPFAVEDRGNGQFAILIYDNNFPALTREMLFDRNKNSWSYFASTNPSEPGSLYLGDARTKSLGLYPTNPGTPQQPCPFCGAPTAAAPRANSVYAASAATTTQTYNEIYLDGDLQSHGHLLITDEQGRRTGYLNNAQVNEIPGAQIRNELFSDTWKGAEEPSYRIPTGIKFAITIDGTNLTSADMTNVVMIGPGYDIGVDGINLQPGQKDTLTISSDGTSLSYSTAASETPTIIVGFNSAPADYALAVKGVEVDGGGTLNIALDATAGSLSFSSAGSKLAGTYGLAISRIAADGEQAFTHDSIGLQPDDLATLAFGVWPGGTQTMDLVIKHSSGTTETLTLTNDN